MTIVIVASELATIIRGIIFFPLQMSCQEIPSRLDADDLETYLQDPTQRRLAAACVDTITGSEPIESELVRNIFSIVTVEPVISISDPVDLTFLANLPRLSFAQFDLSEIPPSEQADAITLFLDYFCQARYIRSGRLFRTPRQFENKRFKFLLGPFEGIQIDGRELQFFIDDDELILNVVELFQACGQLDTVFFAHRIPFEFPVNSIRRLEGTTELFDDIESFARILPFVEEFQMYEISGGQYPSFVSHQPIQMQALLQLLPARLSSLRTLNTLFTLEQILPILLLFSQLEEVGFLAPQNFDIDLQLLPPRIRTVHLYQSDQRSQTFNQQDRTVILEPIPTREPVGIEYQPEGNTQ